MAVLRAGSVGLAYAMVLRRYLFDAEIKIPLWTGWPSEYNSLVLSALVLGFTLSLVFLRNSKSLNLIAAGTLLVFWLTSYSNMGAFTLPLVYLNLLTYFVARADDQMRSVLALEFIALVFLLSALQKINLNYLSGIEFSQRGDFSVFLNKWGFYSEDSLNPFKQDWFRKVSALTSVVFELLVGLGIYFRPILFSHMAMIFLGFLSLIHPPVLFVGLFFFPLSCLVDESFFARLRKSRWSIGLASTSLWIVGAFLFNNWFMKDFAIWTGVLGAGGIFWLHGCRLGQLIKVAPETQQIASRILLKRTLQFWLVPMLMCISFFWGWAGAPSPIGFTMFSGQRLEHVKNGYRIEFDNPDVCEVFKYKMRRTVVSDVVVVASDLGCRVHVPTRTGVNYSLSLACKQNSSAVWRISIDANEFPDSCFGVVR